MDKARLGFMLADCKRTFPYHHPVPSAEQLYFFSFFLFKIFCYLSTIQNKDIRNFDAFF